jgi:hypothetical protein
MALLLAGAFGAREALPKLIPALVLANSVGYFLGRFLFYGAIGGNLGMILFDTYGLSFGAGLGYALFLVQEPIRQRLRVSSPASAKSRLGS